MPSKTGYQSVASLYVRTGTGEDVAFPQQAALSDQETQVVILTMRTAEGLTFNVAFDRGDFSRLCAAPNQALETPVKAAVVVEKMK